MFPPDTMATIGPWPALPVRAAANASAPAPSAMTRTFSATRRIARFYSSSVSTIEPPPPPGPQPLPHARDPPLPPRAPHDRPLPLRKLLGGAARERARGRGRRLGLGAPDANVRPERFDRPGEAPEQAAAAD